MGYSASTAPPPFQQSAQNVPPVTSAAAPITYSAPPLPAAAPTTYSAPPPPAAAPITYSAPTPSAPTSYNSTVTPYGAPPTMAPPGGSGTFAQGVAIDSGTFSQGAAPAQNMTYGALGAAPSPVSSPPVTYGAPPMAPPSGSGTCAQGVAMGSGTFAQGAAPAPNVTYEALGAAPNPVSSPPVTYAAPPSPVTYAAPPSPDTVTGNGNVTETGVKIVAVATPPFMFATALPSSPGAPKSAESDEFKTHVVDAVNQGEDMISIPTAMAVGLLEKGLEPYPTEKPLKVSRSRRTGGCC